ncbi:hypothetical protein B5S33_g4016 [[Candida] boidinii]|nr:hypothetical protein B5S30_g221 [[Candida] boidinii]OWB85351.1 hypothetical protein B5S33_g4016 [[Candida] boidinii]
MFRDRTNLYISYRSTFPHHNTRSFTDVRFDSLDQEESRLVNNGRSDGYKDGYPESGNLVNENGDIEMTELPPNLVDLSHESEMLLADIQIQINELTYLYKKNILPGFNDTSEEDAKIEELTFKITKNFQNIYNHIRNFDTFNSTYTLKKSEVMMCDNIKRNLALRTQDLSTTFRRLQNNYIKYLKQDEYEIPNQQSNFGSASNTNPGSINDLEATENIESYSRQALQESQQQLQQSTVSTAYLEQREREIYKIAQGVVEISTIFKELENMVIDQGTILDRIDYNLIRTVDDVKKADKEMKKAEGYQKQTRKCKIVMFLVLLIIVCLMLLLVKPKRVDHYYNDGGKGHKVDQIDGNTGAGKDDSNKGGSDVGDPKTGDTKGDISKVEEEDSDAGGNTVTIDVGGVQKSTPTGEQLSDTELNFKILL